jgi:hypothetical protein
MPANRSLPGPDFADLLARMDHRRGRRRALFASAIPVVAGAVVIALMGTAASGGPSRLKVAREPSASPTASATPGQQQPNPSPTDTNSRPDAPSSPSNPTDSPTAIASNPADVPPPAREQVPDEPVRYTFEPQANNSATCGKYFAENTGPIQWCGAYPGATTFTAGVAAELPIEMCRGKLAQTVDAHPSRDGEWLNASVTRLDSNGNPVSGGPAWSWARPAPPANSITFAGGDCARWTISWAAVDDYGQPLTPGQYRLYVQFLTEDPTKPRDVLFLPVDITVTS